MDRRPVLTAVQLGCGLLPAAISLGGLLMRKAFLFPVAAVLIAATVCFFPLFRKRANLWAFLFMTALSVPLNLYLFSVFLFFDFFDLDSVFLNILIKTICFCMMYSIEQILIGVCVAVLRRYPEKRRSAARRKRSAPPAALRKKNGAA